MTAYVDEKHEAMAGLCGCVKTTEPGHRTWLCMTIEHEQDPDRHYWVAA